MGEFIDNGPGGRLIIAGGDDEPDKVGLPLHHADAALTAWEKNLLLRWIEASELAKGNYAVAKIEDEPRGRYAEYSDRWDLDAYAKAEVAAYRWILENAFGKENATLAEIFARMSGERVEVDFVRWGQLIANSNNFEIGLGAAIGTARALAWALKDAYRDYAGYWQACQNAARAGRALTEDEATRRIRRGKEVRRAYQQRAIDG